MSRAFILLVVLIASAGFLKVAHANKEALNYEGKFAYAITIKTYGIRPFHCVKIGAKEMSILVKAACRYEKQDFTGIASCMPVGANKDESIVIFKTSADCTEFSDFMKVD